VGTEDIDRFVARNGLGGMISRRHPEIPRELLWVCEFTFREKGILTSALLVSEYYPKLAKQTRAALTWNLSERLQRSEQIHQI
jgi:hypothetical protein